MGSVHQFEPRRPQEPDDPHSQGEVICGACEHVFRGVSKVGDKGVRVADGDEGFECPKCHAKKGVYTQFLAWSKMPTWHCECCGGWLFQICKAGNGDPCFSCANCGNLRNLIDAFPAQP